mmetsp:Transcript_9693/g.21910  ORF Transcript_9693/g.21910 Transcript_9693/m.21910 type:complete len:104 (-) Transcript_9693:939-1250(-)
MHVAHKTCSQGRHLSDRFFFRGRIFFEESSSSASTPLAIEAKLSKHTTHTSSPFTVMGSRGLPSTILGVGSICMNSARCFRRRAFLLRLLKDSTSSKTTYHPA